MRLQNKRCEKQALTMIVGALDGRFLGHPFLFSIEKERPWQRLSPASKLRRSEFFIYDMEFTSTAPAENSSKSVKV